MLINIIIKQKNIKNNFVIQKINKPKLVIVRRNSMQTQQSSLLAQKQNQQENQGKGRKNEQILFNKSQSQPLHEHARLEETLRQSRFRNQLSQRKKLKQSDEQPKKDELVIVSKNKTKIKSKSVSNQLKPLDKPKKLISLTKKNTQKNSFYMSIVEQMLSILTSQFVIQMKTSSLLTINKEKFKELFVILFETFQKQENLQRDEFIENAFSFLQQPFQKLKNYMKAKARKTTVSKLRMNSNVFRRQITRQQYSNVVQQFQNKIITLKVAIQEMNAKIKSKQQHLSYLIENCVQKQKDFSQLFYKIRELQSSIQKQQQNYNKLMQKIEEKNELLSKINDKTEKIFNFVELQEQKKILHWVSEAYKDIQSQIYDYALYLQTNAMASSLVWQPKPFRAVQKWINQQMERVNQFVMSPAESNEDKSQKMKDFITNTTRKFRNKDQEMMKITDYKTECIRKFIKMMQKWLENWQLKQEYLTSLRIQFAAESKEIDSLLERLYYNGTAEAQRITNDMPSLIQKMTSLWHKIVLNYKYGNSFY